MKTVMITGSSKGLGKALAMVFAINGYDIILHGRNSVSLEEVREDVLKYGAKYSVKCDIVQGDIRLDDTIFQLTHIAREKDIDTLINNAAVYMNEEINDMIFEDFRKVIDINLIAPMLLAYNLFPLFKRKQSGLIVNINSMAGKTGSDGETAYCASKHGLSGFAKALQFDATRNNIRVVDIYPGAMKTDMTKGRKDWEKFIDPLDAARLIFKTCEDYPSMRINEIDISRRKY